MDILHPRLSAVGGLSVPAPALAGAAAELELEVVDDVHAFAALRAEWCELLESSSADCIFLSWEWMHTWWKHLSAGRRLHIITARRNGRLMGLAPLAVRPRQPKRLFPFHALEFIATGSVGSDYLDLIIRRGEEVTVTAAFAAELTDSELMLELSQVKLASTHAGVLAARLLEEGWSGAQTVTDICPYVSLEGRDWASYLGGLGSAHRANVRRRLRNLQSSFAMTWEEAADEESRQRCLRNLLELHSLRWETRQGSDAFHSRKLVEFHDEWTRLALKRGWLRLYLLSLDREPAAAVYGIRYRDVFHFYQSGFDPAYSSHSVGLAALAMSIRDAIEEGAVEYDFLHGSESYKFLWTDQGRDLSRLELFPPNSSGLVYRQAVRLRHGVKAMIRRSPHVHAG